MKNKTISLIAGLCILCAGIFSYVKYKHHDVIPIGYGFKNRESLSTAKGEVGNFSLLDHNGVFHELYRYSDASAVVIISQGNDCPIIQKYSLLIRELKKKFEPRKVVFLLLNSNVLDTRSAIINEAKNYQFDVPILMDPSQNVAKLLGITRTSEAVVLNPKGWKLLYRGSISDRLDYGTDKQTARNNYLNDVLSAVVNGIQIKTVAAPAKGCLISFVEPKSLSYEKEVAPIIAKKCLNCHTEDKGFLPRLDGYEKLKSWTAMAKETILTERMPPWSSDPLYGSYSNDISLTAEEKRILVQWFDLGAPNDGKVDPLKNYHPPGGSISKKLKPLYSATMPEPAIIPAKGDVEYRYFQLGEQVPFDIWVSGYKTSSTNPRQLHHESLMVTSQPLKFYEERSRHLYEKDAEHIKNNEDGDISIYLLWVMNSYERRHNPNAYLRAQIWAAGRPQPFFYRPDMKSFIPKGSYLILETHYMGTGKEEKEKTTIKFYGQHKRPVHVKQIRSMSLSNMHFEVPPMEKDFIVESKDYINKRKIYILNFLGHLHMRGKSVKMIQRKPNGEEKTIISVPNYYYGWQTGAPLTPEKPIEIEAGSALKVVCHYDNSPSNPYNPDPSMAVRFGQRSDRSEMCKFNFNYYEENAPNVPLWETKSNVEDN